MFYYDKKYFYIKLIFIAIFLSISLQAWDTAKVDIGVSYGNVSRRSIAVDSSGVIHGVYGGRQLYHKQSLSSEVVDTTIGSGKFPSFVIDSSDILHIAYGTDTDVLKCAIGTFDNYQIYTVDTGVLPQEQYYSIDVNSSGATHIVYIKSHDLKHAWYDGTWHYETLVSSNVQNTTSLAIDDSNLHISYVVSGVLKYRAKISGTWITSDIDTSGYSDAFSSIGVASNGDVYIAFLDTNANELKLAIKHANSWSTITLRSALDTTGWAPSLTLEGTTCYISFRESDAQHKYIKYVVYDGSSISTHDVAEIYIYGLSSIAVSNNNVYVLYNSDVKTIKKNVPYFAKATNMGHDIAVDSDSNAYLHVSYIDFVSKTLHYATNAPSGIWSKQRISNTTNVAKTAIAVDENSKSHICYYDRLNRDLKYVTNRSGSWSVETVDSNGDIGGSDGTCDIDVNSSNGVHISYYDYTNDKLKYALKDESGGWVIQVQPTTGGNLKYNSITLNSSAEATLAYGKDYIDNTFDIKDMEHTVYFENSALHYLSNLGSYTMSVNANHSTIAVDSNQNAYISFYDTSSRDAKLLSNATGKWELENIATAGDVGAYASVVLSSDDTLNVCYHDSEIDALVCSSKTVDRERNALTSLYYATNGEHWIDDTNWLSGDKCTWNGIFCNANNKVTDIILNDNNLSGALPKEMQDLNSSLSEISIANNHITDISVLAYMKHARELYLSNNPIGSLEAVKDLHVLKLSADNIGLTVLPHFSSEVSFTILSLSGNHLSSLSGIEDVVQIIELDVSNNELTDISALASIDTLVSVDFLWNRYLNDISALSASTHLRSLGLVQTAVSDLSVVVNFPDLELLHAGKLVTVSDLAPLTHLTKMNDLSLWLDDTVSDISALSNMSQMKTLFLSGGGIENLSSLASMSAIEDLTVRFSKLRDISALKNLTMLKNVNLEFNYIRDIVALANLTQLYRINFSHNCIHDFSPVSGVPCVDGSDRQRDAGECMAFLPSVLMYLLY